ncbi:MAG TPA: alkaline shock response membrane anchor protein AmaP [Syntrophomonadaceae bacterium]|nr:alkaline shock response membrane anchor protein AmaP [Syntrophomonadaceae bacterium]
MPVITRLLLFLYNVLLIFIAGMLAAAGLGRPEPLQWIEYILATPTNRLVTAIVGLILLVLGIIGLVYSLKSESSEEGVPVANNFWGQVSISVAAIKVIIAKAVKEVEGVKDVRAKISSSPRGVVVELQMNVNPELPVPELTKNVQEKVQEYLEKTAGLEIDKIKVLVDDLNTGK